MPQVVKSAETKIITKNGECTVSIKIEPIVVEVNINTDGVVSATAAKPKVLVEQEEEKTKWVVPTFGKQKIEFGKEG